MPFDHAVTDPHDLAQLYREPHPVVLKKVVDRVDGEAATFIAASPFVVLATHGPRGADASPRGGPPGFVTVLDEHRLAIGDLSGNNRIDTIGNVLATGLIGMLFLVPGIDETVRVNGRATITTDPEVLTRCAIDGRVPRVAIGVDVEACFLHCAKAFRRSGLWSPETWLDEADRPSTACIVVEHLALDVAPELVTADLEAGYQATMWEVGG
jgi:PPOX class probable FMN-dependent enzyme